MAATATVGLNGRYNRDAPGWLGSFSPEDLFLLTTEEFFVTSEVYADEYRIYEFIVKNATSNAVGVATVMFDLTTITVLNTGGSLFTSSVGNAGTINLHWEGGILKVENLLASSASAQLTYFRKDAGLNQ